MDISKNNLKVTLWGEKAKLFSLDNIYDEANNEPILILFVGCLVKDFKGETYLSGGTVCHWYFNPDIQEATTYYSRKNTSNALLLSLDFPTTSIGGFLHALNVAKQQMLTPSGIAAPTVTGQDTNSNISWVFSPQMTQQQLKCYVLKMLQNKLLENLVKLFLKTHLLPMLIQSLLISPRLFPQNTHSR